MQELQLNHTSSPVTRSDRHEMHRPRERDNDTMREANRECPPTSSEFNRFHDKVVKSIGKNSDVIDKHFDKGNKLEIIDDKADKKDLGTIRPKEKCKDKSLDLEGSPKDKSKDKDVKLPKDKTDYDGSLSKDKSENDGCLTKDKSGTQSKDKSADLDGSLSDSQSSRSSGDRSRDTYSNHVFRDQADYSRGGPSRESSDGGATRGRQR